MGGNCCSERGPHKSARKPKKEMPQKGAPHTFKLEQCGLSEKWTVKDESGTPCAAVDGTDVCKAKTIAFSTTAGKILELKVSKLSLNRVDGQHLAWAHSDSTGSAAASIMWESSRLVEAFDTGSKKLAASVEVKCSGLGLGQAKGMMDAVSDAFADSEKGFAITKQMTVAITMRGQLAGIQHHRISGPDSGKPLLTENDDYVWTHDIMTEENEMMFRMKHDNLGGIDVTTGEEVEPALACAMGLMLCMCRADSEEAVRDLMAEDLELPLLGAMLT